MIKEFKYIVNFLLKLNEENNILNQEDKDDLQLYLSYFIKEKEDLLNNMYKLSNLDKISVIKIIATKIPTRVGPVSSIILRIDKSVLEYENRFYMMKRFLRKLLYYYKQKAKVFNCKQKYDLCGELAIYHQSKQYTSGIPELEQLMKLIEIHNNYLDENRILNDKLIVQGYKHTAELSVLSCEIQAILNELTKTAYDDFCQLDLLLRLLTEKINKARRHIEWINDNITRKMLRYPDGL